MRHIVLTLLMLAALVQQGHAFSGEDMTGVWKSTISGVEVTAYLYQKPFADTDTFKGGTVYGLLEVPFSPGDVSYYSIRGGWQSMPGNVYMNEVSMMHGTTGGLHSADGNLTDGTLTGDLNFIDTSTGNYTKSVVFPGVTFSRQTPATGTVPSMAGVWSATVGGAPCRLELNSTAAQSSNLTLALLEGNATIDYPGTGPAVYTVEGAVTADGAFILSHVGANINRRYLQGTVSGTSLTGRLFENGLLKYTVSGTQTERANTFSPAAINLLLNE